MVRFEVVVRVDTPHLVGAADEVDAQFRLDVRRVVRRLREVVDATPHQHPERARVVAARALHDPVGALGLLANPDSRTSLDRALLGEPTQGLGLRVSIGVSLQVRVIHSIPIDDLEDVLTPAWSVRRRDDPLDVEHIGIQQEVHHRLEIVRIGAADVGRHEDTRAFLMVHRLASVPLTQPSRRDHGRRNPCRHHLHSPRARTMALEVQEGNRSAEVVDDHQLVARRDDASRPPMATSCLRPRRPAFDLRTVVELERAC